MRLAVAISVIIHGVTTFTTASIPAFSSWTMGALAIVVGALLLIGFLTPIAGALPAIGYSAIEISLLLGSGAALSENAATAIDLAVMSIALVLLGPGAFSLDARLFGRREIIIPERRR
jgi:uncharacterized membrane protein YphA (DoxX/SURF4 family)